MTDYSNSDAVIRYLNAHDVCGSLDEHGTYHQLPTVVSERLDGLLVVRCNVRLADGTWVEEREAIAPTVHAARAWLGY